MDIGTAISPAALGSAKSAPSSCVPLPTATLAPCRIPPGVHWATEYADSVIGELHVFLSLMHRHWAIGCWRVLCRAVSCSTEPSASLHFLRKRASVQMRRHRPSSGNCSVWQPCLETGVYHHSEFWQLHGKRGSRAAAAVIPSTLERHIIIRCLSGQRRHHGSK